eukprot:TRINITY_DN15621_c0_g1_i5.p1 TRINITY_DN15621_c0_g1~~TRINITY_DN15621_c0_g1_i5.p1  ORF type:complete len:663 (-),score=124.51 TRINITY_DN15621_c0_g1_i5:74-1996(-)
MAGGDEARVVSVKLATGRIAKDSLLNRFGPNLQAPPGHPAEDDGGGAPAPTVSTAVKEEPLDEPQEISGDEGEHPDQVEPSIKLEPKVKNELGVKGEPGIKLEPQVKIEPGIKAEPGIKFEPGTGVKRELSEDEDGDTSSPKRRRIRVKSEPGVSSASSSSPAIPSPPPTAPGKLPSFRERLPGWIKDCLLFQKNKRTWAPTRPCCPANCFFEDVAPPPKPAKGGKYISCFHRLTSAQQVAFRHFYEQNKENLYCSFLFAEKKDPPEKPKRKPYVRPEPEADGRVYKAFEMMKMWPWSRELPSFIWKPGYFIKDGIAHKVDHCGEKVPFTKVWESRGTGPPDKEAETQEHEQLESDKKETGAATTSQEGAASSSSSQGTRKRVLRMLSKRSGEPGICWKSNKQGWDLKLRLQGKSANGGKGFSRLFPVSKYISQGYSEEQADKKALEDAKACKQDLVRRGIAKDTAKTSAALPHGSGVSWDTTQKAWVGRLQYRDAEKRNRTFGSKKFYPKGSSKEALERARKEAEAFVQDLRVKHSRQTHVAQVKSISEMAHHSSSIRGISWSPPENCWHVQFNVSINGHAKNLHFRTRPKDETQEEVDRSFQEAAAWLEEKKQQRPALQKSLAEELAAGGRKKIQRKK